MIALDTNILVYAHRADAPFHAAAAKLVRALAEGRDRWVIPWPCAYEFLAIVTHPRIYRPPTPADRALAQLEAWISSPSALLVSEEPSTMAVLLELARTSKVSGPVFHDAKIAALALHHGVRELWTADRDFGRFPRLRTRNPLPG